MKKELKFTGYFMTVLHEHISIATFKSNILEQEYHYKVDEVYYTFTPKFTDKYLFIHLTHGSPFPLPDKVINTDTLQPETNPRSGNQYEPKDDFAVVDFTTGYLWISNTHRKNFLWTFFTDKLHTPLVSIKEVYDEENFINTIHKLDEIKFSAVPSNLFSATNTLSSELDRELNGYEATTAVLHLKYKDKFIGENLKSKIMSLVSSKGAFKNVMIAGRDLNNISMLFNSDTILKKILIKTELNTNGTFNADDVFNKVTIELSK